MGQTHPPGGGPAQSRRLGRPSLFTPELAEEICRRLAEGETLTAICAEERMPVRSTVYLWLDGSHPDFSDGYARARRLQADTFVDDMVAISDASVGGSSADVQAARLRFDARAWVAARVNPAKWSERTKHELSGPDGGPITLDARSALTEKIRGLAERVRSEKAEGTP